MIDLIGFFIFISALVMFSCDEKNHETLLPNKAHVLYADENYFKCIERAPLCLCQDTFSRSALIMNMCDSSLISLAIDKKIRYFYKKNDIYYFIDEGGNMVHNYQIKWCSDSAFLLVHLIKAPFPATSKKIKIGVLNHYDSLVILKIFLTEEHRHRSVLLNSLEDTDPPIKISDFELICKDTTRKPFKSFDKSIIFRDVPCDNGDGLFRGIDP